MDGPSVSPHRVTHLLEQWSRGDDAALAELTPLVYQELRRLAHNYMGGQRPNHTLQTTALVNEVYMRLADQTNPHWQNRAHFFAVAAPGDASNPGKLCQESAIAKARRWRAQSRIRSSSDPLT